VCEEGESVHATERGKSKPKTKAKHTQKQNRPRIVAAFDFRESPVYFFSKQRRRKKEVFFFSQRS
jgi:hypothetical protein